jgi:hypothetical protein
MGLNKKWGKNSAIQIITIKAKKGSVNRLFAAISPHRFFLI